MAVTQTPPGHTTKPARHGFVDALRGFALLGIIVVNIEFIIQPSDVGWYGYDSTVDRVVRWLSVALGQAKIYPIFAMLFGYGMSIQLANATRKGTDLTPRHRRRTIGLLILGLLHGILFFPGDILVIYAVIGAGAYRFRSTDTRRLLWIAAIVYAVAAVVWLLLGGLDLLADPSPPSVSAEVVDTLANGSFLEVVVQQSGYWIVTLGILSAVQGPAVFSFYLVGLALGRTDWLSAPHKHQALARKILMWAPLSLIGAAVGATLTIMGDQWGTLGFAIGFAVSPFVAASYLAALALTIGNGGPVSAILEAGGRMSLTVYLLESVVLSTLAFGYGFGLVGDVDPLTGMGIAIAVYAALTVFAVVWMRFFRFGPFEWALRSFTYGERQTLRRA